MNRIDLVAAARSSPDRLSPVRTVPGSGRSRTTPRWGRNRRKARSCYSMAKRSSGWVKLDGKTPADWPVAMASSRSAAAIS